MAKNNKHTRRYAKIRRRIARFFLIIFTLLVMIGGTYKVVSFGGKVLGTQFKMAYYYLSIEDCKRVHNSYQAQAANAFGQARRSLQNQADAADAQIDVYNEKRSALQHSDDPVVAFAGRNQFDFFMFLLGVACFGIIGLMWYLLYRHFVAIVVTEEKIFNWVVSKIFMCLALFFYAFHLLCYRIACIYGKQPRKKRHHKNHKNDNIVPFKRRIG